MTKFSDLALDPRVLQAVQEAGYEIPTPIQAQAIPHALQGRDVLGIAQTGTGKTASFVLPMITLLGQGRAKARMPRSLVLAPTRELAAQVAENFETYAKHTKLTKALLIGGVSFGEQDKLIDRGVDVLIATPGRLLDHHERGKLMLNGVQIMVVDEADRMLDMGFIPDIERIFKLTPFTRQTFFYSATMAPEIERLTNTFLQNAVKIEVARQATSSETIEQALIQIAPTRKDAALAAKQTVLRALIRAEGEACTNAIIFCNRKMDVDVVAKGLKKHGFNASPIHGDLDQSVRTKTLDGFRDGSVHLLVASDVAARGLDIPAVSHVFNFDVPSHPEDYVHRIGRTGRAGRKGKAYTIATPYDDKYLAAIQNLIKQPIPLGNLPEGYVADETDDRPAKPEGERSGSGRGGSSSSRSRSRSPRDGERKPPVSAGVSTEALDVPQAVPAAVAEAVDVGAPTAPRTERSHDDRPRDDKPRDDRPREGRSNNDRRRDERPRNRDAIPEAGSDRRPAERDEVRPRSADGARRDTDRRDDRRRDTGPNVVGMGEHVPDFITRSFRVDHVTQDEPDPQAMTDTTEG